MKLFYDKYEAQKIHQEEWDKSLLEAYDDDWYEPFEPYCTLWWDILTQDVPMISNLSDNQWWS